MGLWKDGSERVAHAKSGRNLKCRILEGRTLWSKGFPSKKMLHPRLKEKKQRRRASHSRYG
jgi:hypothetical protein